MKRVVFLFCFLSLAWPIGALAGEKDFIGGLRNVHGAAVVQRGAQQLTAKDGLRIHMNDVLITGKNGSMGIIFKDNTRISLGPESKLTVTRFVYQPAQEKYGFISRMVQGTVYFISGAIEKASPGSVKFKTPVATIGTRGTAFLARVVPKK